MSNTLGKPTNYGCIAAFTLVFAAIGIGMTIYNVATLRKYYVTQSWVETPATITRAELKEDNSGDSATYQAVADYEYDFGGQHYKSSRVSVVGGSDNVGDFQRSAFRELKRHLDQKRPFRCFVDPNNPSDAVLYRNLRWELLALMSGFGATFGALGLGLFCGAMIAARQESGNRAPDAPADQPWLARRDWAAGQIRSSHASQMAIGALAVAAVWWFIATIPIMSTYPEILGQANRGWWKWLTLLFPVVGVLISSAFAIKITQRRKFGESVLELATVPGTVGGQLVGVVRIPRALTPDKGFRLTLNCIQHVKDSEGSLTEKVAWQDEQLVTEPMRDAVSQETAVPVSFEIPFDALETSRADVPQPVDWRLEAVARMPGVNYHSRFEVPVFKTADSQKNLQLDETLSANVSAPIDTDEVLREAGIIKEPLAGGGVRLIFAAARNKGMAVFVTVFLDIWLVIIWAMVHFGGLVFFPIVFGLFAILMLLIAIDLWFTRSVVEASPAGLSIRGGPFGLGATHTFAADEIADIRSANDMSSGTHVWTRLDVIPQQGRKRTIAKGLPGKMVERAVLAELNGALVRLTDSEGQFDTPANVAENSRQS